jgi:hypothetical protein
MGRWRPDKGQRLNHHELAQPGPIPQNAKKKRFFTVLRKRAAIG